jgi:predicted DNA-binding transcriptional regulator AlpA
MSTNSLTEPASELLTVREVASLLKVSERQAYVYFSLPDFPVIELSERTKRVRREALDAWQIKREKGRVSK